MASVGLGTYVTIEYEISLASGKRVLARGKEKPWGFRFGTGECPAALEREIMGLKVGDAKNFTLQPEDAFGRWDGSKVIWVPLEEVPRGKELARGTVLEMEVGGGLRRLCFVGDVQADHVVLDFNHPLAGRAVTYRVKVLEVQRVS
jgi:FKBP-type peptidyl-prolyl cis-trans isomerase SlpA